ncbi:MAG: hypothetical protein Q4F35_03625, partial [Akkermansia sp.]|nr:hypothetical protein [Akkermansia sp.]
ESESRIRSSIALDGDVTVAGQLMIDGSLQAAGVQAGNLQTTALKLTDAEAQNRIGSALSLSGNATVAGSLEVGGAMSARDITVGHDLTAEGLSTNNLQVGGKLTLNGVDKSNTIEGDINAGSISLASGVSLKVGGTLTTDEVSINGTATLLQAGAFGASTMNFDLDRAALESLGLGYRQTATIARAELAMSDDFEVLLNGEQKPIAAAAYNYSISVSGGEVCLTADYAYDGLRTWYRGDWVGDSSWTDFYVAGFDAVDSVEVVDLKGTTVEGANLFIAYEDGVSASIAKNGDLEFEYVDMGGGQFELGENTNMITDELYGKGETLVVHENASLDTPKLTLGTLVMDGGEVTLKNASINAMSGTEGTLYIDRRGMVTVGSDVTLTELESEGTLDLGTHALMVNALVDGGNVTAGEVTVKSLGSRMAVFDVLEADKVTVTNVIPTGNYTDDISVGGGSAIGELVAETLEVRGGEVTLGRTSGSTEMSLLDLDLQDNATLVLNQQTRLTVTNELTATERATVQLHKGAGISYGEVSIANRKNDSPTAVNAYELSEGTISSLSNAHISMNSSDDSTIDWQLINSSVENTGSGTVTITNADNSLTDVYATHGNITILQQESLDLAELKVGASVTVSAYTGDTESPEYEATITVSDKVSLGAEATLNTDLIIEAGATLEMGGTVDMGSKLYLNSNTTLGGELLTTIQTAKLGSTVTLFTGIDALYFNGKEQTASITLDDRLSAGLYFSNLLDTDNRFYYMLYEAPINGDGMLSIVVDGLVVPEPTTATLSLLALAALAARRRRTQEK